ncbi:MAG: hypothetical protein HY568_06190, partial [Candidatus Latescibacteria bacterium]|nr:hypothetical protein [Candidatus Latescibacterota bacterium]
MRSESGRARDRRFLRVAVALLTALSAALALAASSPAPAGAAPESAARRQPDETYRLKADRLSGSAASNDDVYTALRVTVEHGTTTVRGDSARIYRQRELVEFLGNVTIVDGDTRMWGDQASYDRRSRLAVLRGNVRINEHNARITGKEARFFRDENRSVIVGDPRLEDSTRTLTADRIEYDRGPDLVTAVGNVVAIDRAESTRVRAGRVRYDRRIDYAWATESPVLSVEESGGKSTVIHGRTLEFDNAKRRVFALGDVVVEREKLRAECDRAEFYQSENRAFLLGTPRAWDEQGKVQGDTLEIRFKGRRVESLQVRPHASVDYETKAESGRGERSHAVGDTVTLVLTDDEARKAVIVGHAQSSYRPSTADSAEGGRNVSTGDSIIVEFERGRARKATVVGRSEGIYYMAAEGDTSRERREEQVRYRGNRVVYDVDRDQVDVVGSAEVTYKELRLLAEQVEFNTKTQRMRAVGSPVLNDGKDRITGHTMTYDLSIRRGTIFEGKTTYERGFYHGEKIRKVSENVLDVENGSYTTCDLDEPHFHFGSSKMKILLRDKVIARPVVFYIKHVPVLALPFYIFPIKQGRHSGFQLPQLEFGSSSAGGKFIRNLGYYWAISDYLDATLWGDYYQQVRWIGHAQTRYNKRYRWQGEFNSSFEHTLGSGADRWDLFGRHYQTLGPNFSLTAQGNLTNSSTYLRDASIGRSILLRVQRNLRSSLSLQKSWSGVALNVGLIRNQDLDPDRGGVKIGEQLPAVTFSLTPRPIGHLARGKEPARLPFFASTLVSLRSTLLSERNRYFEARAETTAIFDSTGTAIGDTVRFSDVTDVRTAARHDVSLTDVRSVLGFLRVSPNMTYSEVFYSKDAAGNRLQRAGVWRGGIGVNTAVFGTFRPSLGPLRAIRHVITPSVGFNLVPAYPKLFYRDASGTMIPRFSGVSGISLTSSESRSMTFSIRNDVHVKWGDPTQPKVINNLIQMQTSGSYDFLARRRGVKPLSDLSSFLRLRATDRTSIDMSFAHNPYDGKLLRFDVSSGLFFQGVRRVPETEEELVSSAVQAPAGWSPLGLTPSGLPWMVGFSLSYGGSSSRLTGGGYSRWESSTKANGSVGLNPTKNWRVDYAAQYDFKTREMISQNYSVKRDLHCWEAQFTRSISGGFSEYYFKINVKNLSEVYYEQGSRGLRGFGG